MTGDSGGSVIAATTPIGDGAPRLKRSGRWIAGVAVLAVLALAGAALVGSAVRGPAAPSDTSADAGFARDMQAHHAQAVRMSFLLRERTDDPVLQAIAYDIITSQQHQIGQMYALLESWGLSQGTSAPPMAWMSSPGDHTMTGMSESPNPGGAGDLMPGMASPEALAGLEAASGVEAEKKFLELMIEHHRGGVVMADAYLERGSNEQLLSLASKISAAQAAEISQMETMLAEYR